MIATMIQNAAFPWCTAASDGGFSDDVGVVEGAAIAVSVADGDVEMVGVALAVGVADTLAEGDGEADGDADADGVGFGVAVLVGVGVGVGFVTGFDTVKVADTEWFPNLSEKLAETV